MAAIAYIGGGGIGKKTATAGTRIRFLLGGNGRFSRLFTHLINIRVVTSTTAHVLTVLRGMDRAEVASDLAAAGTALVVTKALLDGAGNAIAANDLLAIRLDNGDWHLSTISAWDSGTKTATLNTAIPTGRTAKKGAQVVSYGVQSDSGHADFTFDLAVSTTNQFPAVAMDGSSLVRATAPGEPLLIDIDNGTAASTVSNGQFGYSKA